MKNNRRRIELPDDDIETVVIRGGVKVEFNVCGGLVVSTNGDVKIVPANDDTKPQASSEPNMPDGPGPTEGQPNIDYSGPREGRPGKFDP